MNHTSTYLAFQKYQKNVIYKDWVTQKKYIKEKQPCPDPNLSPYSVEVPASIEYFVQDLNLKVLRPHNPKAWQKEMENIKATHELQRQREMRILMDWESFESD